MVFSKMADLAVLVEQEIPEGRNSLQESHTNLERVAEYCETKYFQVENKRAALEETKNYTTQSLASVAYQINTLAYNFLQMLDLQTSRMAEMESNINHIGQMIMIHKEKVARREIGVLTTNKNNVRQHRIIAPSNQERPIKYIRKPIDYTVLDDVGHGVKSVSSQAPSAKRSSSSISSMSGGGGGGYGSTGGYGTSGGYGSTGGYGTTGGGGGGSIGPGMMPQAMLHNGQSGPPPTTKPPTPPQQARSVSKGSREYRTLAPPVAPPIVPSNYAPNYPIGHPRAQESRRTDRGSGYGTLPNMSHSMMAPASQPMVQQQQPQIGMVHPMAHSQHSMPAPSPVPSAAMHAAVTMANSHPHATYNIMPVAPPPPPTPPPPPMSGLHSNDYDRMGNVSPPLPPPPEDDHSLFMANYTPPSPPSYSHATGGDNAPSWIPAHYLEKVVAIYDYMADKDDELSFSENSVIYVVKKNDDGWYEGVMDGVAGLFPGNYVEPCM